MNSAMSLSYSAASVAANFAPIPALAPAVDLFFGIMQLCANVSINRKAARQIQDRCYTLLLALQQGGKDLSSPTMIDAMVAARTTLTNVQSRMRYWASKPMLEAVLNQAQISQSIQDCHIAINDCFSKFQLVSHVEIHKWQDEYKIHAEEDHNEVLGYLSDIQNAQAITNEALTDQKAHLQQIMSMMQNTLADPSVAGHRTHDGLQSNLYHLQHDSGELLPSLNLKNGEVRRVGNYPVGGSAGMDIWEGLYLNSEKVAIKVIRAVHSDKKSLRRFQREVKIWAKVWDVDRGRHVLPFYGFSQSDGPYPYMVSPWQPNGTAISYVKRNDSEINYKQLICGIAEGLNILHNMNPPVVHGDLKGVNIVINAMGNPLLADFGLSQVVEEITGVPFTQSRGVSESYRWFAPEVCIGQGILSISSDVYAFAMTALELFTHKQPFSHIKHTTEVVIRSGRGEIPRRPTDATVIERGLDDSIWSLLGRCWSIDQSLRPSTIALLHDLRDN